MCLPIYPLTGLLFLDLERPLRLDQGTSIYAALRAVAGRYVALEFEMYTHTYSIKYTIHSQYTQCDMEKAHEKKKKKYIQRQCWQKKRFFWTNGRLPVASVWFVLTHQPGLFNGNASEMTGRQYLLGTYNR